MGFEWVPWYRIGLSSETKARMDQNKKWEIKIMQQCNLLYGNWDTAANY